MSATPLPAAPATAASPVQAADDGGGFQSWTPTHLASSGVSLGLIAVWIWLGRRWRGSEPEARLRWFAAGAGAVGMVLMMAYWFEPARADLAKSLPIELCDLATFVAVAALLAPRWRWASTLVVFWAVGLSSQAFIQPTLTHGPRSGVFWFFWFQHVFIVGAGLYAMVVLRYRPTLRDLGFVALVDLALFAAVLPVDVALGANYMFIGEELPEAKTVLHALGPWPMRAVWVFVLAHLVMAALVGVVHAADRVFAGRPGEPGDGRRPANAARAG